MTQNNVQIPAGYRKKVTGELVPESMIKPIDKARDELVLELVEEAKRVSEIIAKFKSRGFDDISAFVQMSAEQYQANLGGKKGNVTLHSFDGKYKVQLAISENLVFDERLQAAKALIDECINEWATDSRDEIKVLVHDAFQTDKEGKINTGRVLGLRRLDIKDPVWQRAMTAISESVQVVGSKAYMRFYECGENGQYKPISLDIAAV